MPLPTRPSAPMKLDLRDVTVCAADCATTSLAARALCKCMACCSFADAILFSDAPPTSAAFRGIRIQRLESRADYSRFILKDLHRFVSTPYVLIVQWDGYVLDTSAWTPEFLSYDLIGAKWPWYKDGMTVGNGGFSLRSGKLLRITGAPSFQLHPDVNEDEQICRLNRAALIRDSDVRFAPESLAARFSYERSGPDAPTFGFHGLFNMWRHVDDSEMLDMSREFGAHVVRSIEFRELLLQYVQLRKFPVVRALYSRWQQSCDRDEIRAQLVTASGNQQFADSFVRFCETAGALG
jgi:Protein of unknown function (DUF5672)